MARKGRFARGGTGGSNLSQLVFDIMRQQMSREVNGIVDAYTNQTDWRGGGVPTLDEVLSALQGYLGNSWVTQSDRDNIAATISQVRKVESARVEDSLLRAIDANPTSVEAVMEYVGFLKGQADSAESPNLAEEAKGKMFTALGTLSNNIGLLYEGGGMSSEEFDRQKKVIINEYSTTSGEYRQLNTIFVSAKYKAEFDIQNTALATAGAKGAKAYESQLRLFSQWVKGPIAEMHAEGLATVDDKGNVTEGIDAAMEAQRQLAVADGKLSDIGKKYAAEAAAQRYTQLNTKSAEFLKLVNQTLGSNYSDVSQFMQNQIDVQRFYSNASPTVRSSEQFMSENRLMEFMFGSGNSIMNAAKAAGQTADYKILNNISKNYGRNTLVDDAAIIFSDWMDQVGSAGSNPKAAVTAIDQAIGRYQDIIKRLGDSIPATEMEIHKNTLNALIEARSGKTVDFTEMSAFDLANPFAMDYNKAVGVLASTFQEMLGLVSNSSAIYNEIAEGGKVLSGAIDASGRWQYGPAVNENRKDVLSYYDPTSKQVVGVAPVNIIGENSAGEEAVLGYLFDLGNGKFVVRAQVNGEWITYEPGYDPFSKREGLKYKDFKSLYTQRTPTNTSGGEYSYQQDSEFILAEGHEQATTEGPDATKQITDPTEIGLGGLQETINSFRSINNPDIMDRRKAITVADAAANAKGTSLEAGIKGLYTGLAPFSTANLASPASFAQTQAGIQFRAGERDISGQLAGYAFRNTPMSSFFGSQAGKDFRAGEREDLGIKPIGTQAPAVGGRPRSGPIKL